MQRKISQQTRQQAELQFAEIVGRLNACEYLENGAEHIEDHKVLYGWGLLTQEVLIRLAEATLKLVYQLYFDDKPPHGHSLKALWDKIPTDAKQEIKDRRGQALSFDKYDGGTFQDVRYSAERLQGGQTRSFQTRQLYLDSLAVTEVAEDWLGEVTTWPWSSIRDDSLSGYQILPITDNTFEVWVKEPIEPMDWAGAIITPREDNYFWTLYFGFTDRHGEKHGYELPCFTYPWPMTDIFATSVMECVEKIHRAYQEPSPPLLTALEEARRTKRPLFDSSSKTRSTPG